MKKLSRFVGFDLEIGDDFPDDNPDGWLGANLPISCAGLTWRDRPDGEVNAKMYSNQGNLSQENVSKLVWHMESLITEGYKIATWNGLSFDFQLLHQYAKDQDLKNRIARLAKEHVDMMFVVVCIKGYRLGLEAASKGMGLSGKLKEVTLRTGETITDMSGAKAPQMWKDGEYKAVLAYLQDDCEQTMKLAEACEREGGLRWVSRRGRPQIMGLPDGWPTVQEANRIPEPDTSWMTNAPSRDEMLAWTKIKELEV